MQRVQLVSGISAELVGESSLDPGEAVDCLIPAGTCVLLGSARKGTEVSFETPFLQNGRTVRGVIQGDSRPRDFIPRLVDLFMAGRMRLDRFITRYDFATSTARPPRRPRAL